MEALLRVATTVIKLPIKSISVAVAASVMLLTASVAVRAQDVPAAPDMPPAVDIYSDIDAKAVLDARLWAAAVCSLVLIAKERLGGALAEDPGSGNVDPFRRPSGSHDRRAFRLDDTAGATGGGFRAAGDCIGLASHRSPFTLQYARETTSPEIWKHSEFMAVNRRIALVWAAAFAVLVLADAGMAFLPQIPHGVMIPVTVAALLFAFKYTAQSTKAS
ncbi:hypothetical protein [Kaistia sp. UC242_56]|uniref:hypothetical protein n=1 Tax=Kaistia sp. UC242_56 TaxID=3374625 RepID=UPI0037B0F659